MSRVILSRWEDGEEKVVAGFDNPFQTFFIQKFTKKPDPNPETGEIEWPDDWQECEWNIGMLDKVKTTDHLKYLAPEEGKQLLTDDVIAVLTSHMDLDYPESNVRVDMAKRG